MSRKVADWISAAKHQVGADPKKTVVLASLFVVLIVLVGRLFVGDTPPASAQAAASVKAPAAQANRVVPKTRPVPQPVRRPVAAGAAGPYKAARAEARGSSLRTPEPVVSIDGLPRTLERNVFDAPSWQDFPRDYFGKEDGGDARSDETGGPPSWGRLIGAVLKHQQEKADIRSRVAAELAELRLQSTMTGPRPLAHISGRLVREGDTFRGFSVVRIEDRRVILRKSGLTRRLVMP